jgi:O-antigen/teichoic acid export membrane protein
MLLIQLAAYTALLNLGVQGATSRYVAFYTGRGDTESARNVVSTAFFALVAMAIPASALVVAVSWKIDRLFPALPAELIDACRSGLLLTGLASALCMPGEAIAGTFTGLRRNELTAFIQGGGRVVLAVALIVEVMSGANLTALAATFAMLTFATFLAFWWTGRRVHAVEISLSRVHTKWLRQIWSYCGALIVWSIAILLINGFDTAIVARVEFSAVGVYSACFGPILLIAGIQQALFGPLLQLGAVRTSQDDRYSTSELLLRSTRLSTLLLLALSLPLLLFGNVLLAWWLGPKFSNQAVSIFSLLLVGNAMRLIATPYSMLLLATVKHGRVLITPIVEASTNVAVAIGAGIEFGAIGVACGVVVGAVIGLLMVVYVNVPKTPEIVGDLGALLRKGVAQPAFCALPGIFAAVTPLDRLQPWEHWSIAAAALISSALLGWKNCITRDEKILLRGIWRGPGGRREK